MIRCFSLWDITATGNINQKRNWHTLLQSLHLRTEIIIENMPKKIYRDIGPLDLGQNFTGYHAVWVFDFSLDDQDNLPDVLEKLMTDSDLIPMIGNLENTVKMHKNYTITQGPDKNICFFPIYHGDK
jgi:hypothetical protein